MLTFPSSVCLHVYVCMCVFFLVKNNTAIMAEMRVLKGWSENIKMMRWQQKGLTLVGYVYFMLMGR